MSEFISGLELSRLFYAEAVRPILEAEFPGLSHSAAILGSGSEVLGFDTVRSTDHHWGPRVMLFLSEADHLQYAARIREVMRHHLPHQFHGFPTNYVDHPLEADKGVLLLQAIDHGPVNHRVDVLTVRGFLQPYLNFDGDLNTLTAADWLTFSGQQLRTLTHGAVYYDGLGELTAMRQCLAYYPHDVWLYLLAAGWRRIDQEEPFVGRTGEVGDELGSCLIAGRLVRDLMRLCFLMERQYAPYPKWFGTAFARLTCAATLMPIFDRIFRAESWQDRGLQLAEAYHIVAEMHNALGITAPLPTTASRFFGRPFLVIHGGVFVDAIRAKISDPEVKRIADMTLIGATDQFADSTDLLSYPRLRKRLKHLYDVSE